MAGQSPACVPLFFRVVEPKVFGRGFVCVGIALWDERWVGLIAATLATANDGCHNAVAFSMSCPAASTN